MTLLFILMAVLTAGVCVGLVQEMARTRGKAPSRRGDRLLAIGVVVALPVAALAVYLTLGRPDLKGQRAVSDTAAGLSHRQAALLAQRPMQVLTEQNPDDIGAHLSLAEINRRIGRTEEEVRFLARAVALAAEAGDPLLRRHATALGQAQVRQNGGIVGDEALATFAFIRGLYPEDPLARHFEALALAQRGDPAAALALWRQLLAEGSARAPWKGQVRRAMGAARRQLDAADTAGGAAEGDLAE